MIFHFQASGSFLAFLCNEGLLCDDVCDHFANIEFCLLSDAFL